jgi:hypothetical protein
VCETMWCEQQACARWGVTLGYRVEESNAGWPGRTSGVASRCLQGVTFLAAYVQTGARSDVADDLFAVRVGSLETPTVGDASSMDHKRAPTGERGSQSQGKTTAPFPCRSHESKARFADQKRRASHRAAHFGAGKAAFVVRTTLQKGRVCVKEKKHMAEKSASSIRAYGATGVVGV